MSNFLDEEYPQYSDYRDFTSANFDDDSFPLPLEDSLAPQTETFPVYRSAGLVVSHQLASSFGSSYDSLTQSNLLQKPTLQKPTLRKDSAAADCLSSVSYNFVVSESKYTAPEPPFLLMATHFEINVDLDAIVQQIEQFLKEQQGLSFEFVQDDCQWNAVYLNGSNHSKIQISVYKSESQFGAYIVEGNRLNGDGQSFRAIYSQLREQLCPYEACREADSFAAASPMPVPAAAPEPNGIDAIIRMAKEHTMEAHLEAARILCDVTMDEVMLPYLCENGCVDALHSIISTTHSDWAKQHAMVALANISDSDYGKEAILEVLELLPILLKLATNGPDRKSVV